LTNASFSNLESRSDLLKESLADVQQRLIDLLQDSNASAARNATIASEAFSRLESRSFHIEEILASVRKGLTDAIEESNSSTTKSTTIANEALSRLENRLCLIDETLTKVQELLNSLSAEKASSIASEGFSRLESRSLHIEEVLTSVQELLSNVLESSSSVASNTPIDDNVEGALTSEAFSALEDKTNQIKETLASVQELLTAVLAERSNNEISSGVPVPIRDDGSFRSTSSPANEDVNEADTAKIDDSHSVTYSDGELTHKENALYVDGRADTQSTTSSTRDAPMDDDQMNSDASALTASRLVESCVSEAVSVVAH
jgi:hypothetical protein